MKREKKEFIFSLKITQYTTTYIHTHNMNKVKRKKDKCTYLTVQYCCSEIFLFLLESESELEYTGLFLSCISFLIYIRNSELCTVIKLTLTKNKSIHTTNYLCMELDCVEV